VTYRTVKFLHNAQQGHEVLLRLWTEVKPYLLAGHKLEVRVKPETRSTAENALLHALISEIAAQKEWAGKKRDAEVWKRLLVASWCRVHGEAVEILPALDGHGVDIVPARTSQLSKAECADLITYVQSWAIDNGIELRDPQM
jgi:hypothetical protein